MPLAGITSKVFIGRTCQRIAKVYVKALNLAMRTSARVMRLLRPVSQGSSLRVFVCSDANRADPSTIIEDISAAPARKAPVTTPVALAGICLRTSWFKAKQGSTENHRKEEKWHAKSTSTGPVAPRQRLHHMEVRKCLTKHSISSHLRRDRAGNHCINEPQLLDEMFMGEPNSGFSNSETPNTIDVHKSVFISL